jgi:hypothetical protein
MYAMIDTHSLSKLSNRFSQNNIGKIVTTLSSNVLGADEVLRDVSSSGELLAFFRVHSPPLDPA